jgi:hypothetical protein
MARGSVSDEEMLELQEAFAKVGEWTWGLAGPAFYWVASEQSQWNGSMNKMGTGDQWNWLQELGELTFESYAWENDFFLYQNMEYELFLTVAFSWRWSLRLVFLTCLLSFDFL